MTSTAWNSRTFPYPLLGPPNGDYQEDVTFRVNIPKTIETNGKTISLSIQYYLGSQYLNDLISNGQAEYLLNIDCVSTKRRQALTGTEPHQKHVISTDGYHKELVVTPYVIAKEQIQNFTCTEHNHEYAQFNPQGITLPIGSIIAVGQQHRVNLQPKSNAFSIIDIVTDPNLKPGDPPTIDTEGERIKIGFNQEDKLTVESIRTHRNNEAHPHMAGLYASVYMPAIAQGLLELSEHKTAWATSLREVLETIKIAPDVAAEQPIYYAQKIMENPVRKFMATYDNGETNR